MALSVSDIRSNINEQIDYAAGVIGKENSHAYKVFEAVYYHKSPKKSLSEIIVRSELTRIQVQKAAANLVAKKLITKTKENGEHYYHVDQSLKGHKNEILDLVRKPEKRKRMKTKRDAVSVTIPVKEMVTRRRRKVKKTITVLYTYSNSTKQDFLHIDDELKSVRKEVDSSKFRDQINIEFSPSIDAKGLVSALNKHRPEVLHFSGHSDLDFMQTSGEVLSGARTILTFEDLNEILKATDYAVKVLVLNSCYSVGAAQYLSANVDVLIGMNDEISDVAAIAFSSAFYAALSSGQSVQSAYGQGVNSIRWASISESPIPEILVKDGINPSKLILV